ncbi:MAG TPA: DUF2064 domain-containing protein [Thermoanaerobaculia bacterium]|nr:DUF2064 domain-containing protein [Thermoanaerobaculia bacterium]
MDLILSSGDSASRCGDNKAIPQRGNGFDERFRNAMLDVAGLGYQQVVAIPIDVLELSVRHLDSAFVALRESPFVLGPSPDGGVYLIGFRSNEMPRFERIAWRTGRVFDELVEVLRNAVVIEPLADVDSLADLRRLSLRPKLDLELRQLLQSLLDPRSFGRNREEQRYLRLALPLLPARAPPAL